MHPVMDYWEVELLCAQMLPPAMDSGIIATTCHQSSLHSIDMTWSGDCEHDVICQF